jgi:hypothetical protein
MYRCFYTIFRLDKGAYTKLKIEDLNPIISEETRLNIEGNQLSRACPLPTDLRD